MSLRTWLIVSRSHWIWNYKFASLLLICWLPFCRWETFYCGRHLFAVSSTYLKRSWHVSFHQHWTSQPGRRGRLEGTKGRERSIFLRCHKGGFLYTPPGNDDDDVDSYSEPGTKIHVLQRGSHFALPSSRQTRHSHHPSFTDVESVAKRIWVACLRSHNSKWKSSGSNQGLSDLITATFLESSHTHYLSLVDNFLLLRDNEVQKG